MKPLDVIGSIDFGYRLVWQERAYLLRLAMVPLLVKFTCLLGVDQLGLERDFIRAAMVMLPASFTEGWMLAHLCRLVFFGQRWPFRPTGDTARDEAMLADRAYGVMSGTLFYVVIKFLMSGLIGVVFAMQTAAQVQIAAGPAANPPPGSFLALILALAGTLWAFRLIYLYIPAAGGLSLRVITNAPSPFRLSVQMMGISLIAMVPLTVIALYILGMLGSGETLPLAARLFGTMLQILVDSVVAMITTAAIAGGIKQMMSGQGQTS